MKHIVALTRTKIDFGFSLCLEKNQLQPHLQLYQDLTACAHFYSVENKIPPSGFAGFFAMPLFS